LPKNTDGKTTRRLGAGPPGPRDPRSGGRDSRAKPWARAGRGGRGEGPAARGRGGGKGGTGPPGGGARDFSGARKHPNRARAGGQFPMGRPFFGPGPGAKARTHRVQGRRTVPWGRLTKKGGRWSQVGKGRETRRTAAGGGWMSAVQGKTPRPGLFFPERARWRKEKKTWGREATGLGGGRGARLVGPRHTGESGGGPAGHANSEQRPRIGRPRAAQAGTGPGALDDFSAVFRWKGGGGRNGMTKR